MTTFYNGNLVYVDICFEIWNTWGLKTDTIIGYTQPNTIGLIIKSLESQGGNGCEILFQNGTTGWTGIYGLKKIN
jgi:hypothetical protein